MDTPNSKMKKQVKLTSLFQVETIAISSEDPLEGTSKRYAESDEPPSKMTKWRSTSTNSSENIAAGHPPRKIKSSWFQLYPWLTHEKKTNMLYCNTCRNGNMNNIFTLGKLASEPKKDDFIKHEKSVDHKVAASIPAHQSEFKKAVTSATFTAKDAIICQMRTILTQAKHMLPTSKNQALVELQVLNGCTALSKLNPFNMTNGKGHLIYTHHESIDDFYQCLATVTKEDILAEILASPFKIYTLEADEATDTSNNSVVVVYIRYIGPGGNTKSRFIGVRELSQTTANAITTAIEDIIKTRNLDDMVLAGLATDGASVMLGTKKGVATQFKQKYPQLLTSHCMAHRLQLVAEKSANQCTYLVKYISILNTFAKSLKYSPKLCRILDSCKAATGEKAKKVKQVFFTRWLSFTDSVQALAGCLSSVISAVYEAAGERNIEGRAVLVGCAKQMATYKFVYLTAFLSDAVGTLGILNKTMQKGNIQYSTLMIHVKSTILALEGLLEQDGPYVAELKKDLPAYNPEMPDFVLKGHDIKDNAKERKTAHDTCIKFIDEVVTRLAISFPENGIMDALGIFDPSNFNAEEDLSKFGTDKLKKLINHFEITDEVSTLTEWNVMKGLIQSAASAQPRMSLAKFYETFVYPDLETFPNIGKLVSVAVAIPATSVNCERAISNYNAIKTPGRASLKTTSVEDLIILCSEAPSVELFPYDRAFEVWATQKDRKSFRLLTKIDEQNQLKQPKLDVNQNVQPINEKPVQIQEKPEIFRIQKGLHRIQNIPDGVLDLSCPKTVE